MTAPSSLFGDGAALDAGIDDLCGTCPRYHHCAIWLLAWLHPEQDVPAWAAAGDAAACAERDLPVPRRRAMPGHVYPADAQMDGKGLPLGRYGPDGRLQVGTRENCHGRLT